MKDLTEFIQRELYPRVYDYIPCILPELRFSRKVAKWQSELHFDGTEGTGKKEDRLVVTSKMPNRVFCNTTQSSKDLITLFMELNGIRETWEAVNKICNIIGIQEPEYTPEAKERYAEAEKRRTALEESHQRQMQALGSKEGREVQRYLLSRGWEVEEILQAELGYISRDEAIRIDAQRSVGDYYTLSIPLRTGGRLYGFKFRTIKPKQEQDPTKDKYTYLFGTQKKGNLFNLVGTQQREGSMVVVEGELDALHAEIRGVKGIVATGGGQLTEEFLTEALERGIKRITLLFDKDERGAKFVKDSIAIAHKKGISVLVATFPDGESLNDGRPVHDIDEYLTKHTAEELQTLIDDAATGSRYLLTEMVEQAVRENGGDLTDSAEIDLRNKVIELANDTPNEVDRDIVFSTYAQMLAIDGKDAFSKESIKAVADRKREEENIAKQANETKAAIREAQQMAERGEIQAAVKRMEEAAKDLRSIESRAKYSDLLTLPTEASLKQRLENKQEEIPTRYELGNGLQKEIFTLPCGAITFVCAPTSHGKSTLLQNLALQAAESKGEGSVLYFTFEEEGDAVTLQMMNKYIATDLCRNYSSRQSNNIRALSHYYKTGEAKYITTDARATFDAKREEFISKFYTSGKIRIYYKDYDSSELIEAIRCISSQIKVKAVFIDYIQLLSGRAYKKARLPRTEELKEICKDLKDLAIDTQLPIVVAAQLNREANSPLELHSQKIAEAADLERIANKILCLWNTSFNAQSAKDSKKDIEALQSSKGFVLGVGGQIYAKLTKNRGGVVGLDGVFTYNGNTGVIEGNAKPEVDSTEDPEDNSLPFADLF